MRLNNLLLTIGLCVSTAVIHSPSVEAKGNEAAQLQRLYVSSGFQKQFDGLPEFMGAIFAARLSKDPKVTADQGAKVRQIITETFDVARMSRAFLDDIDRGLTPRDLEAVLQWMDSPLGARITRLETNVSSGMAYKQMKTMAVKASDDQAAVSRAKILTDLDAAAHFSEARVRMKMDILKTMAGFSDVLNGQTTASDQDLSQRFAKQEGPLKATAEREVLSSGRFIYRSLSDEELNQYLDFYRSPAGKKYAVLCRESFATVFAETLRAAEKRISEELMVSTSSTPATAP